MPREVGSTVITPTTKAELESTVTAAHTAFEAWRRTSAADRAASLNAVADALDTAADELVPLAMQETHLPKGRLRGELKRTTFQLRIFGEVITQGDHLDARIDHADADWPMGAPRPDLRRVLIPLGPVVVFSASNFPFAFSVAGGDTASSLAAGCSVILKAHSGHPQLSRATGAVVTRALAASGAPDGLFSVIYGTQSGRDALEHPLVKAGAFTGSISGGRALFDIAQSRPEPIPFYGELGSVNPVLVTASRASDDEVLLGFVASFTAGSGQFCTKPGLLVVPREANVPSRLAAMEYPAGSPLLNKRIQSSYADELQKVSGHASVDTVVKSDDWISDPPAPTVLRADIADVIADSATLTAEVFGPTGLVIEYDRENELLDLCAVLDGQLTVSVFAEEADAVAPSLLDAASLISGRVLWNSWPTGVSVTYAQQHGGPYPATTAPGTTSVGTAAVSRFVRPVAYQGVPDGLLPAELQESNPLHIAQRVNGSVQMPQH